MLLSGYKFEAAATPRSASTALGDGPNGFSFESNLMQFTLLSFEIRMCASMASTAAMNDLGFVYAIFVPGRRARPDEAFRRAISSIVNLRNFPGCTSNCSGP